MSDVIRTVDERALAESIVRLERMTVRAGTLDDSIKREIWQAWLNGGSIRRIAEAAGLSRMTASRIINQQREEQNE